MKHVIKNIMNMLTATLMVFTIALPSAMASAKIKKTVYGPAIVKACQNMVKRKMPEVKNTEPYCECAAKLHITKTPKFNEKMAEWLINLYNEKQSADAIEKDVFGIAAFDIDVFAKCQVELNPK